MGPADLGELSRASVDTIPECVIRAIGARVDAVGPDGRLQPLGVVAGMVFAMLTWASHSARLTWFESLEWLPGSPMLCGLRPILPGRQVLR